MGDGSIGLKHDLQDLEVVIRRLSIGINGAGITWKDSQFEKLAGKIGEIASLSKTVIRAGQKCDSAIKRFESIAAEV